MAVDTRYGLEKHKDGSESEEEIWAEELMPKVPQAVPKAATPTNPSDKAPTLSTKPSDNSGNYIRSHYSCFCNMWP